MLRSQQEFPSVFLFPGSLAAACRRRLLTSHIPLQNLHVGTRLWGMVLEVTPRGLVVSLPYGMRGTVAPEQVRSSASANAHILLACMKLADVILHRTGLCGSA